MGGLLWAAAVAIAWDAGFAGLVAACAWAAVCVLLIRPLVALVLRRAVRAHPGRLPGAKAAVVSFCLVAAVVMAAHAGLLDRWAPEPTAADRRELARKAARDRAILTSIAEHLNRRAKE